MIRRPRNPTPFPYPPPSDLAQNGLQGPFPAAGAAHARRLEAGGTLGTAPSCDDAASSRRLAPDLIRSQEHTSELQSRQYLVCRLLLQNTIAIRDDDVRDPCV